MYQFLLNKTVQHSKLLTFFNTLSPPSKGVTLALISTALFTIVGVFVRKLSADYDTFQILFFRQFIFMLLLVPAMIQNVDSLLKPNKVPLHILRILGAFIALYFGFVTVSNIPFADATALGFLQVIFVAVIARVALNEQITGTRIFTIIVGFIGVMIVVRPTFEDSHSIYILSGVVASLGAGVAVICVRKVAQSEPKITLMAYQALTIGFIALLPTLFLWRTPTLEDFMWLLMVGGISSLAQYVGISAYKWAQANIIANVEYVKIIYSIIIGIVIFSEVPDTWSIVGALVILASALTPMIWSYHRRKSQGESQC
ncbi:DMT family transporter [Vibrio sp. 1CM2L]|uniref:DMT family transporter n=1 Tax=Vibrio sp. 1CM2L TaxID=2929166 RepID=UPI0020C187E0|nr:DMT family transporter [Vibrio sp. 1CM2L]MCK8074757.1 DMT family transporter [Vibrio sp. 1CM2L]